MKDARRAIFGGSFDPVHCGHLLVAERLCDLEAIDRVVFVPARRSPHKRGAHAPAADRLAMLRLAVRGNPRFGCSDLELRRGGPSFTIDTVRAFAARWGARPILFLGGDALLDLAAWHESAALRREARIVVYARPEAPGAAARARALGIAYHAGVLAAPSSRAVRATVRSGGSIRYQVPEAVRRYIKAHRLYVRPGSRR